MSVRRMKRRDPITGARREFWMIDVDFQHADGSRQRVRKVSPVQTRRGAEQYERDLRNELLAGTFGKKEAPTFAQFVDESWWPTYPSSVGNAPSTIVEKEHHLRLHLKPELAKVRLDRIKGEVVDRLFAALRQKKLRRRLLRTCARHCGAFSLPLWNGDFWTLSPSFRGYVFPIRRSTS